MDDVDQALGRAMRRLRSKRGWSQEKLALEAGIDRNYISLIELGKNSPSVRMLFRVATALGTSPSDLLAEVEGHIDRGTASAQEDADTRRG